MKSPLTGFEVETTRFNDIEGTVFDEPNEIGKWAILDDLLEAMNDSKSMRTSLPESSRDRSNLRALMQSKVWEATHANEKKLLFITVPALELMRNSELFKNGVYGVWQVVTVEELDLEASRLTLEEKCLRTLVNLVTLEGQPGKGLRLAASFHLWPSNILGKHDKDLQFVPGLVHGATGSEIFVIFRHLEDSGLIEAPAFAGGASKPNIVITPNGYIKADTVGRGQSRIRSGFLVCRFDPTMDKMYESVYKPVGLRPNVNCPLSRVKDIHHVDRIDDRIIIEIHAATIVVVDLTGENFNVAFEAGYALALGKPIVWAQRDAGKPIKLPFDIQSQNIMRWKAEALDEYSDQLAFRMQSALEKANTP